MSSDAKLGESPSSNAVRDAIHVAIFPAIADANFRPGDTVSVDDGKAVIASENAIGIIDPYRLSGVKKGERVWVCLFPGAVIGMTHHWEHPHFDGDKVVSERWLREYAKECNPYDDDHDAAFRRLIEGLRDGDLYFYGSDLHGLHDIDDPDELKHHAQVYLGMAIDWDKFTFNCSC